MAMSDIIIEERVIRDSKGLRIGVTRLSVKESYAYTILAVESDIKGVAIEDIDSNLISVKNIPTTYKGKEDKLVAHGFTPAQAGKILVALQRQDRELGL